MFWFWSHTTSSTVTGGSESSGGPPGQLQRGGDPGQGPVQHPGGQRHLEDGRQQNVSSKIGGRYENYPHDVSLWNK